MNLRANSLAFNQELGMRIDPTEVAVRVIGNQESYHGKVRTLEDMTESELAAIEKLYKAKINRNPKPRAELPPRTNQHAWAAFSESRATQSVVTLDLPGQVQVQPGS